MTPRHHPSDATLLAYAAGALGEALSLVVASHLAFCPECIAAVANAEAIGGSLFDSLAPEPLAADAHARVIARLADAAPETRPPRRVEPASPVLPAPLARYIRGELAVVKWRLLGPGLRHFELIPRDLAPGTSLRLLKIGPGRRLPHHGHRGTELTLVLTGSYEDALGAYASGDVAETDTDIVHEPVSGAEECICLIGTEGKLRFTTPLARLVQRFTGI